MVKAVVDIDEHANKVLNVVKAKYGLNDKSEAINVVVRQYEKEIMEPELRPEFVESVRKAQKGRFIKVKKVSDIFR